MEYPQNITKSYIQCPDEDGLELPEEINQKSNTF